MAKIQYVGNKVIKADNVAGTGVVWDGNGDVQDVPDSAVAKLIAHSGIWKLAGDDEKASDFPATEEAPTPTEMSEADARPPMANLDTMDDAGLRQYAQRYFNHAFHHNTGEAKMRQTIIGLMNRG